MEFCNKDRGVLVGKSSIDFSQLNKFLNPAAKQVIIDGLELKEGYCFTGTFSYDPQLISPPYFAGFLTGKECMFFGYRIKTLFSNFHFSKEGLFFNHLKMSDEGGVLHIDSFSCIPQEEKLFLSIPEILFEDIRPSLLRDEKEKERDIDPLLIKQIKIKEIQGDINRPATIKGYGSMKFINSFNRGQKKTLFDLPSEVIGKIFGLDLELLIPVKGSLDFILEDNKFIFTALKDAYSQNKRSQFFLFDKTLPYMDFNASLHVNIQMKQFVLFKVTEQMIISITGDLYKPKISLQNKRQYD